MFKPYHNSDAGTTRSPFAFLAALLPAPRPPAPPPDTVPALPAEFPCPTTERFRQLAGKRPANVPRQTSQTDRLLSELIRAGRPLSVTELAQAMGCCRGEASKRVTAAGKLVVCRREGRFKMVAVRQLSWPEWQRLRAAA